MQIVFKVNKTLHYEYVHILPSPYVIHVVYERAVGVADECHKSAVLCVCAMVAYAKSDIDMCKTFLFRA